MSRTLWDYFVLLLTVAGSLASIFAFGKYITLGLEPQGWIGVLFTGTLAYIFLGYCFYLIWRYRKRVKYASIFEELNIAF